MGKTPFKMKGFSGFGNSPMTKKSPAKDDPHKTTDEHAAHKVETEKVDEDAFEKILLKQSDEGKKPLTEQEETILGKYRSRMFKEGKGK